MGRLMIKCPKTGKVVYAGITMDSKSKIRLTNSRVRCSACGEMHDIGASEPSIAPD